MSSQKAEKVEKSVSRDENLDKMLDKLFENMRVRVQAYVARRERKVAKEKRVKKPRASKKSTEKVTKTASDENASD